jgi:hypothetical protein
MKAILINPKLKRIEEVEHKGDLKSLYKLIDCRMVTCAIRLSNDDVVYADDEGLCNANLHFFIIRDSPFQPIIGNGLVVGSDDEGGDAPCKSTLEQVKTKVTFLSREEALLLAW